jgi:hypothetical protein
MALVRFALLALSVGTAACGRIDFDPAGATPPPDTAPTASRSLCDVTAIGDVTGLAGAPIALRVVPVAATTSTGPHHAILVGTDTGSIYAVRATAALSAVESVHLPLTGGYALRGAGSFEGNVFVQADFPPDAYLKRLDPYPQWDTYGTMDQGTPALVDPPVAALAAGSGVQGIVLAGQLRARTIDAIGNEVAPLPQRPAVAASFATTAQATVRVATDLGDGTCATSDAGDAAGTAIPACAAPLLVPGGNFLLHRDPTAQLALRDLTAAASIAIPRRTARAAVIDATLWVASADPTTAIAELVDGALLEGPLTIPPPFDLVPAGLVWLEGITLHRGTPCRD